MEEEIDLKELIIGIWKKKFFVIAIIIIFSIIGVVKYKINNKFVINESEEYYVAEISFIPGDLEIVRKSITKEIDEDGKEITLENENTEIRSVIVDDTLLSTYNGIIYSVEILNKINDELNLEIKQEDFRNMINLTRESDSNILKITVKYNNEEYVEKILYLVVNEFEIKLQELYSMKGISVIDYSEVKNNKELEEEEKSSSKVMIKSTIKFAILGFVLACGIVVMYELFDDSVKNESQLEKKTNLKNLVKIKQNDSKKEDTFRLLRVNIKECKNILITSGDTKSGKTYVANNLAKSFAKLNKKVVLIDLVNNENDLITKNNGKGLLDYLNSDDKFIEKYVKDTKIKNLGVLPLGNKLDNITELLEDSKMLETLKTLERLYDVVIIDSANVLDSANTLAVAKLAKFTLLVVAERNSKLENIVKAKNNIEDVGGNVLGTVLNQVQ